MLSNLATLKAHLLTPALVAATDYDARIRAVGQSVLGQMEAYTGRRFLRAVSEQLVLPGGQNVLVLSRLPIESIASVETRERDGDDWVVQSDGLDAYNPISGVVHLAHIWGDARSQLRITVTAGFWFEPLEPTASGYPSAAPSGCYPLPDELRAAWLLQCGLVWRTIDKLGTAIAQETESAPASPELLPQVRATLNRYRLYAL